MADGWSIGYDQRFGKFKRLQQCFLYARYEPDSNYYAHPLDVRSLFPSSVLILSEGMWTVQRRSRFKRGKSHSYRFRLAPKRRR